MDPVTLALAKKYTDTLLDVGRPKTISGTLLCLSNVAHGKVVSPTSTTVCGKNIFDQNTRVVSYIKNDSGEEVYDGYSSYFAQLIPVMPRMVLSFNFVPQRYYMYDAAKTWLGRSPTLGSATTISVPDGCYWIQVQAIPPQISDQMQIEYGDQSTEYEAYTANHDGVLYSPISNVWADDLTEVTVYYQPRKRIILPNALSDYGVWEPEFTTNDYAVPPYSNQAALDLSYVDFLETFYDPYLGTHGDYVVSKKSLGHDSGGLETWEYAFTPRHYAHTVLITAGMNACEISPIFGCAFFVRHLMEQTEPGMKWLRDNVRFRVIPVLCPSSFDQNPKIYGNTNGVNINKNFNHLDSWTQIGTGSGASYKGEAPDSEPETKLLKTWLANYAQEADFWIDCHSMYSAGGGNPDRLHYVIVNDAVTASIIGSAQQRITDYYIGKGLFNPGDTPADNAFVAGLITYPKHLYAYDVYGLRSITIEQAMDSQWYGGDAELNGDDGDIRNYVLMLRMYILAMLSNSQAGLEFDFEDVMWFVYQQYKAQRGRV